MDFGTRLYCTDEPFLGDIRVFGDEVCKCSTIRLIQECSILPKELYSTFYMQDNAYQENFLERQENGVQITHCQHQSQEHDITMDDLLTQLEGQEPIFRCSFIRKFVLFCNLNVDLFRHEMDMVLSTSKGQRRQNI